MRLRKRELSGRSKVNYGLADWLPKEASRWAGVMPLLGVRRPLNRGGGGLGCLVCSPRSASILVCADLIDLLDRDRSWKGKAAEDSHTLRRWRAVL